MLNIKVLHEIRKQVEVRNNDYVQKLIDDLDGILLPLFFW